jgi:hypothetical protein
VSGYGPYLSGNPLAPLEPERKRWVTNEGSWFAHLILVRNYGNPNARCGLQGAPAWTGDGADGKPKCGLCLEWERDNG